MIVAPESRGITEMDFGGIPPELPPGGVKRAMKKSGHRGSRAFPYVVINVSEQPLLGGFKRPKDVRDQPSSSSFDFRVHQDIDALVHVDERNTDIAKHPWQFGNDQIGVVVAGIRFELLEHK